MDCKIEIIPRLLHFKQPAGTSRGVYTTRKVWYLHLTSPDYPGRTGIGECAPLPALSCDDLPDYEDILAGACRRLEQCGGELDADALRDYPSILFGMETALLHFRARSLQFWHTPFSKGKEGIPINGLIWMGNFDEMYRRIGEKMQQGFRCIKLKIGAIDFEKLAEIAHGYGAYLMVDMAHIAGLVAGGQHQSPVPYADVVTTTTHKTLRGPRGGLILTNNPIIAKRINSAVFPGTQGGPLEHVIAAKAVCFGEALKPEFKEYARKIVENAQALAAALQQRGVKLVSGGTDNHLMLIDLRDEECTGKDLEQRLDSVHITANKNTVPGETRSPFVTSGVRLGTPAVTTRGMGAAEMQVIADCIADCIWHYEEKKDEISERVLRLTREFPLYQ